MDDFMLDGAYGAASTPMRTQDNVPPPGSGGAISAQPVNGPGMGMQGREGTPGVNFSSQNTRIEYGDLGAAASYVEFTGSGNYRYRVYSDAAKTIEYAAPGKSFPGVKLTQKSNTKAWNAIMAEYVKLAPQQQRQAQAQQLLQQLQPALQQANVFVQQRVQANQPVFDASSMAAAPGDLSVVTPQAPTPTIPSWVKWGGGAVAALLVVGGVWWMFRSKKSSSSAPEGA